jgi:HK97 family phage prohead protease
MATLTKSFGIKAESMGEDGGTVTGYASTFSRERDSYGDVVAKGAFLDTLAAWKEKNAQGRYIPLLWGHDTENPKSNIGRVISAEEDDYGLLITAELDSENEKAQYVRRLLKQGRVYQFSFAYAVLDQGTIELEDGTEANELRKLDLFEVSIVPLPANRHAEVTDVKSREIEANVEVVSQREAEDAIAKSIEDATGFLVQEIGYKLTSDALPEVTITAVAPDGFKAGRRNSAKDADDLNRIKELCGSIQSIVTSLLADERADEQEPEPEADEAKANAEEPNGANAEEPEAKSAEVQALLQQASDLLAKKEG